VTDLYVSKNREGQTFSRADHVGRRVFVAGLEPPLTPEQLRAVADLLHVPAGEPARFLDPVTDELRFELGGSL
jgi:hypothetical protein